MKEINNPRKNDPVEFSKNDKFHKSPITVLPDNAYISLGKRLHFRGSTLPVIAVATSEVGPAVLLFVEEVCQVLRFQTNSFPRYQ